MRTEGDYVNINDFVVLRSATFKQSLLTTVRVSKFPDKFDSLVGLKADAFGKKGLQIFRVSEGSSTDISEAEHPVFGGDFIRLFHQELRGYMICRRDDEAELTSLINPVGQYSFDQLIDPDHKCSPFVRAARGQFDKSSCLNVWQILPQNLQRYGKFKTGALVRIRHVLTGLFLCMREVSDLDCSSISVDNKFDPAGSASSHVSGHHMRMSVAGCSSPDPSTLFHIHTSTDISMSGLLAEITPGGSLIELNSSIFFVHHASHMMLVSGQSKLRPGNRNRFTDYSGDQPLRPKEFVGDFAILSETFRIEVASRELVEDTLFAAKFLPLAKASISCLQLTPRLDKLYLPLYSHFNLALHTLVRWTLGRFDSNGQLVRHPRFVMSLLCLRFSFIMCSTCRGKYRSEGRYGDNAGAPDSDSDNDGGSEEEVSHIGEEDLVKLNTSINSLPRNFDAPDDVTQALEELGAPLSYEATDELKFQRPLPISSLSPWLGRGSCRFTKASIPAAIGTERIDDVLAQVNVHESRQGVLRDIGLLEMLQNYVNVVFMMLKIQTKQINQNQIKVARKGGKAPLSQEEREAIYIVPQIVSGCCILCYDIINLCLINNARTAIRLLGVKGMLLAMMSHEFLGWKPPIEQLMLSEQLAHKNVMFDSGGLTKTRLEDILSEEDIADIIEQLYVFHATRNNADLYILRLMVTMACPGKRPNKYIQDQILQCLFVKSKLVLRPRLADEYKQLSEEGAEINHSLLFSTRRLKGSNDWEVLFNADFRFENGNRNRTGLKKALEDEMAALTDIFNSCCSNATGILGSRDSQLLLEKLGFAGADAVIQSRFLHKCTFEQFSDWWWSNRSFYFPSLTSALNNVTVADVKLILADESSFLQRPVEAIPEYDYDVFVEDSKQGNEPFEGTNPMTLKKSAGSDKKLNFMSGLSQNIAQRRKSVGEFISKSLDWMPKVPEVNLPDLPEVPDLNIPALPKAPSIEKMLPKVNSKISAPKEEFESADKIRQKILSRIPCFDFVADSAREAPFQRSAEVKSTTFSGLFGRTAFDIQANSEEDAAFDPVIVESGAEYDKVKEALKEETERYSGLFITLSKSFAAANQELKAKKNINSENWQVLTDVLAEEGDARIWFRQACTLLSELCRGKNSYSQDYVSTLLPPDLIIGVLLRTGIYGSIQDKIIGCAVLTSVYIRHDFVFASRSTVVSEDCPIAVREIEATIDTAAGKLFSQMNRRTFVAISEAQGTVLRRKLWSYLREEIKQMDFSFTTREVAEFNVAVLRLANELLLLGYFDEAEKFLENKRLSQELLKLNDLNSQSQRKLFSFRQQTSEEESAFDTIALENILIDKVISALKELRTNFRSMQDYVINQIQYAVSRGIMSVEEASKASKKISLKKGPNLGVSAAKYVEMYLDSQYSESFRIQATQEVISILWSIFESRQLRRIRNIVGILRVPSTVFDESILANSDEPTQDIANINFSKKVKKIVSDQFYEPREFSLTYFRALFAGTLFQNNVLRGNTYNLIYRSLSPEIDIVTVVKNMRIVPSVEEAAAARFLSVFYSTFEKFWNILLENPDTPSKYVIGTLKFCMDAMTSVCFRKFNEVSPDTSGKSNDTNKVKKSSSTNGGSYMMVPADNGTGSIEMKTFDSFKLELDDILNQTKRFKMATPHPALSWIHHIVKPTVVKMLNVVKSILKVYAVEDEKLDSNLLWDQLNLAEQFFVSRVFSFLATICFGSPIMCLEFFADLSPVLKRLWWVPECVGAADLMAIICQYLSLDDLLTKQDISAIFSYVVDLEEYEDPRKLSACRTIVAILSNSSKTNFASIVCKLVRVDVVENGSIRNYIHYDCVRASDYELDLHTLVLQIILATLRVRTDHQFVDSVKTLLTADFCRKMMEMNIPLQNRASLLEITSLIYDQEEVPSDKYLVSDMVMLQDMNLLLDPITHPVRMDIIEYPLLQYFVNGVMKLFLKLSLSVSGIKITDIKEVITRTKTYVANSLKKVSKKQDLYSLAKLHNFGMRELSDLGEPLNPANLLVGSLDQESFFKAIQLFYNHLTAFDNRLLGLIVTDVRHCDKLLSLMASVQLIYRRMFPSEDAVGRNEYDTWFLLYEILPKACSLKIQLERKQYVSSFLRTEGSDAFISGIRKLLLPAELDERTYLADKESFTNYNDFIPVLPLKRLKKSALYEVLNSILMSSLNFVRIGGMNIATKGNHSKQLKRMNDFDVWLEGGGKYIRALGSFLGKQAPCSISTYTLIHMFCCLLSNDIDKIREQKVSINKMMTQVEEETSRLREVQSALSTFGISEMVIGIVRRCEGANTQDPLMSELGPLALKLGVALLASGNPNVQKDFMNYELSSPFASTIRHMLRKCSLKLSKYLKKRLEGPYPTYLFRTIAKLFQFCGMLCSGHNADGREFMRIQGGRHTLNINLVTDITSTLTTVLQVVTAHVRYISNDSFYELLGPYVWRPMSDQKRRLIAWQEAPDMNFQLLSQISLCLVDGFNALKFICQDQDLENQLSATSVLSLCPALLEFTGSMQLQTKRDGTTWNCSDPYEFCKTYKKESIKANLFSDDKQAPYIRRCKHQWAEVNSIKNKFSKNRKTSIDLIGIDLTLFIRLFADAEQACLRMMNALLDGDSEYVIDALSDSLDESILLQNMDNLFKICLRSPSDKQKILKENISFYLGLLSTLASFVDKPTAILDKYIDQWKIDCINDGNNINNFFAAVEITSPSGILQRVFFPIPDFVLEYWSYPRVQQAKESALWSVSRESPDDKLADFYDKMQGIIVVMRRQQWLARLFPPFRWVRHVLKDKNYIPLVGMREFILIMTILLNIYYAYENFRDTYPWFRHNETEWAQ